MQQPINRPLPLCSIFNARELGGYATCDGRRTKTHRFLRTAATDVLTPGDRAALYDYGVRCVVDLRSVYEVETRPSRLAGYRDIAYFHVPMLDQMNSRNPEERKQHQPASVDDIYRDLILGSQTAFARALGIMAQHPHDCTLFHCSAGKDRTGLTAMFLLAIAGVDEATILQDYAVSETYLSSFTPEHLQQLQTLGIRPIQFQFGTAPVHMQRALCLIKERFDSVQNYLLHAGLCHAALEQLRQSMVE